MSLRKCPNCRRKLLHESSIFKQPFRVSIHCRYCGAEYSLRKGLTSSVLIVAIWLFVVFLFIVIGSLGWSFPFNIMIGSLAVFLAVYVSFRAGTLQRKLQPERSSRSQRESAKSAYPYGSISSTRPLEKTSNEADEDLDVLPKNLSHFKKAG